MQTPISKKKETTTQTASARLHQEKQGKTPIFQFTDNRPETTVQRKLLEAMEHSNLTNEHHSFKNKSPDINTLQQPIQKKENTNHSELKSSTIRSNNQSPIQAIGWPLGGLGGMIGNVMNGLGYVINGFGNGIMGLMNLLAGGQQQQIAPVGAGEEAGEEAAPIINQRMHFVWLGGRLPDERRNNIILWRQAMGEGTTLRLWVDDNSQAASADQIEALGEHNVQIANINTLGDDDPRIADATNKLPTVNDAGAVNPPATGALSDIVRLAALQAEGGTYMDSDNLPTEGSAGLVGGEAPAGFKLGNINGVMSNDAISATPDSPFIEQYLASASANLTDEQAQIILDGGNAARDAVMNTTGPEALARLPLPNAGPILEVAARYPGAFAQVPEDQITISDLRNLQAYQEIMTPEDREIINAYRNRIGMTDFQREQGNAWL
ncbi:glycosyltransferase [Dokdonia sp.]|uniref:glycosyltransferase n=1 Tax=Dokdonia sp. TaxID=2024995 RepID=UPI0032649C25